MATDENKKTVIPGTQDGIIAGVCAGLADFFGLDTVAGTHRNSHPHTLRRAFALGIHHPLADRTEGSEAINRIKHYG